MFPTLTYPSELEGNVKSQRRVEREALTVAFVLPAVENKVLHYPHIDLSSTWYSTGKHMHTRPCVCVQQNHFVFDTIGVFIYNAAALGPQCNAVIHCIGSLIEKHIPTDDGRGSKNHKKKRERKTNRWLERLPGKTFSRIHYLFIALV